MVFLTESWFWRGTQSAIFYYASCTPWVEYKHNRKRRKDAAQAKRERDDDVIYTQPGVTRQPVPFQTNEEWAHEIVQGPGPPKGWKRDNVYYKYASRVRRDLLKDALPRPRGATTTSTDSPAKSDWTANASSTTAVASSSRLSEECSPDKHRRQQGDCVDNASPDSQRLKLGRNATHEAPIGHSQLQGTTTGRLDDSPGEDRTLEMVPTQETGTTGSRRSSSESVSSRKPRSAAPRPSMEKRLSFAVDSFKDAMKGALHPDRWNWIRYERDDEILSNINEKFKGVWDSVKDHIVLPSEEQATKVGPVTTQSSTATNEVRKWQRGTHPALNDMHPPVVSQLPYTREEARWMVMPPPSADVMMGRARPDPFDDINRKPLCVIGRPAPARVASPVVDVQSASSDEEMADFSDSAEEEQDHEEDPVPGWTHIQRPQRAHLGQRSASYTPGLEVGLLNV